MEQGQKYVNFEHNGIVTTIRTDLYNAAQSRASKTLAIMLLNHIQNPNGPQCYPLATLVQLADSMKSELLKPDGSGYTGNIQKIVQGALTSNASFIYLRDRDMWGADVMKAQEYRKDMIRRFITRVSKKKREYSGQEIAPARKLRKVDEADGRRDLVQMLLNIRQLQLHMHGAADENVFCANPLRFLTGEESIDEIMQVLGEGKFTLMMQFFHAFSDVLCGRRKSKRLAMTQQANRISRPYDPFAFPSYPPLTEATTFPPAAPTPSIPMLGEQEMPSYLPPVPHNPPGTGNVPPTSSVPSTDHNIVVPPLPSLQRMRRFSIGYMGPGMPWGGELGEDTMLDSLFTGGTDELGVGDGMPADQVVPQMIATSAPATATHTSESQPKVGEKTGDSEEDNAASNE
eukprot:TRINITY_DN3813_c0_g1_i1.p1 TRINITY_DN3813_c0_g1~~TRINITY_DN3813_c0_g1_i1.p1  ORF type:complete len:401 (-),score=113.63 TRINITY_DN3813_c0_g1_i1:243-1445(-)